MVFWPPGVIKDIYFLFLQQPTQFSSVTQSCPTLWPHESQHARPPCPSPSPGVHSDSHPSSQWCHPAISSSVVPFFSCPQSLPASESSPMSQLFAWGGQSTGASALTSILPKKSQLSYPFICGWTSRLFPCPGYYKQCCDEHWGTCVSFNSGFLGVYAQQWDSWVIWQFCF